MTVEKCTVKVFLRNFGW